MVFKRVKNRLCCMFATLLLVISCPTVMAQTVITGVPGYTNVDNPVGTTVYNITSNKPFNGGAAILNRFTSFVLDNNHTANIILGVGVQTSVNVVNNPLNTPTTINGILNHIAGANPGSPTGGNFIFIDPNGVVVGASGVVNAGSILLSTSGSSLASLIGGGQIDFNNAAQDNLLAASVVDINGQFSFVNIGGPVQINGVLNTMNGNAPAAVSPAVSVFANAINLGSNGSIFARNQTAVNLVTAKNVNYTFTSNNTSVQTPLDNGGGLTVAGQVKSIDGKVLISSNSLDLANNTLNLTGVVDASSLSHNTLGDVTLRSGITDASSGEISLNGAQVSASRNVNINTRKAVNVNGAGTILNAGNNLLISGNGMYLNGTYQTTQGNISINNPGTNPVLIDADMTSQLGGIGIITDGPVVLDYAESLLPPAVIPPNDQVSMALGNVEIMSNGFTSYASIISQGGNVVIESLGDAAFTGHCGVTAQGLIDVLANTIMVNQPFNAINGDVNLNTRTGDVFVGVAGSLSSLNAAINIYRTVANSELRFTANGVISAENVANGLVIGDPPNNTNDGAPIVLDGSTFGAYSGTYANSTTVPKNAQFDPNLQVNNFAMNIYGTIPSPVNPPAPPAPPSPSPTNPDNGGDNNNGSSNNNSNDNNQENEEYFNDLAQENLQTALNNTGTSEFDVWSFPTNDPTAPVIAYEGDNPVNSDPQIVVDEYGNPSLVNGSDNSLGFGLNSAIASISDAASQRTFQEEYDFLKNELFDGTDINWISYFDVKYDNGLNSDNNQAGLDGDINQPQQNEMTEAERLANNRKIAWEGEKEAFNRVFDLMDQIDAEEKRLAQAEKELEPYKRVRDNDQAAYEEAKERYEKYKREHYDPYLEAQRQYDRGEISVSEMEYYVYEDNMVAIWNKLESLDIEQDECLDTALKSDTEYEIRKGYHSNNRLNSLKAQLEHAYSKYYKALEEYQVADRRYNNAVLDQEVRVGNGGSISVNGNQQSMELSPIQYGADGKPVWGVTDYTGRGQPTATTQSLNPRSALLMRGRTPASEPQTTQGEQVQINEPAGTGQVYVRSEN